jgi:hypothetical protein
MQKPGIPTDDLHALKKSFAGSHSQPGNVHYDEEGSAKLAEQVVSSIKKELNK